MPGVKSGVAQSSRWKTLFLRGEGCKAPCNWHLQPVHMLYRSVQCCCQQTSWTCFGTGSKSSGASGYSTRICSAVQRNTRSSWPGAIKPALLLQVDKPDEVYEKEHADSPVSDDDIINTITAYNVAVGKYSKLLRKLLPRFGGYECKEPESGKFTLAFRCALLAYVKQQDGRLLLMRLSITAAR